LHAALARQVAANQSALPKTGGKLTERLLLRIKSERDFWSGLMFVALGIVFAIGASHFSMGPACPGQDPCGANLWARLAQLSADPGPGYLPLALSILLALLGGVVLFKSLTIESEGGDPIGAFAWRPLLAIVVAIAVFAVLLERIGLALTVPALVAVASMGSPGWRWKGVLVNALVLAVASSLVFVWGLKLAIPLWPWFMG
jgi:putative tricarboxylic transport membrane protein